MKKIYSILALALILGAGEANAQETVVLNGNVTIDEVNAVCGASTAEVDITGVTSDLSGQTISMKNPNTLILAKSANQVANTSNVILKDYQGRYHCDNLVITDGYGYYSILPIAYGKLSYSRKVTNEYNTLILPMCFEYEEQSAKYPDQHFEVVDEVVGNVIKCKDLDATEFNISSIGMHHVDAGVPMLVHIHNFDASKDNYIKIEENQGCINVDNPAPIAWPEAIYTLTGKYEDSEITAGDASTYYIQDNQFWSGADFSVNVKVPAFRCVFKPTVVNPAKSFTLVSEDDATSINSVATSASSVKAYNLQGVRVEPTAKGFVIMNGKKYFNK